jgi:hypothetical protein
MLVSGLTFGQSAGRLLPTQADIGISPIAAALGMLTHVTIDFLAVQLSFHFVRHSQALGNTTR